MSDQVSGGKPCAGGDVLIKPCDRNGVHAVRNMYKQYVHSLSDGVTYP